MKKYAFVFSGQGSERVGMFSDIMKESAAFPAVLEALKGRLNIDISDAVISKDAAVIAQNNQLLLLLFHHIMVQLLVEKIGYPPAVCMGHSFGQFSALVHSGAVDFIDMAEFVNARTHIINTPEIEVRASFKSLHGMDMDSFERFLKEEGLAGEVEMALHNQKEQIVCAATKSGEEKLHALSGKYNFVIKELLVSRPYHTTFMEEYNQLLLPHIDKIKFTKPHCPVVLNHAKTAITDEKLMQQETRIQMVKPVFWYESVLNIANDIDAFVVVDPGETQFKIIRRITDKKIYNVNNFNAVKLIEKKRI